MRAAQARTMSWVTLEERTWSLQWECNEVRAILISGSSACTGCTKLIKRWERKFLPSSSLHQRQLLYQIRVQSLRALHILQSKMTWLRTSKAVPISYLLCKAITIRVKVVWVTIIIGNRACLWSIKHLTQRSKRWGYPRATCNSLTYGATSLVAS